MQFIVYFFAEIISAKLLIKYQPAIARLLDKCKL